MSAPAATDVITPDVLLERLRWRYATKKFDPARKIPADVWHALEETLRLTPSSFGLQPWKFIVVSNPDLRAKLVAASWNQRQVVDASHLVVFATKNAFGVKEIDAHVHNTAATLKVPVDALAGFRGMMVGALTQGAISQQIDEWKVRQIYIALGNLLTSAALLGIDGCPMEGFEPAMYDEILGLPALGLHATVVAPLGYRAADDVYAARPKVRFAKEELFVRL